MQAWKQRGWDSRGGGERGDSAVLPLTQEVTGVFWIWETQIMGGFGIPSRQLLIVTTLLYTNDCSKDRAADKPSLVAPVALPLTSCIAYQHQ